MTPAGTHAASCKWLLHPGERMGHRTAHDGGCQGLEEPDCSRQGDRIFLGKTHLCPEDPVPYPWCNKSWAECPKHGPSTLFPSCSSYLPLEELLRTQELLGEDPVSRRAAAWGLEALWPWQKGERRTVTGALEQRTAPWAVGTAVSKVPWSCDSPHLLGRSHCVALIPKGVAGDCHQWRAEAEEEEE